MLQLMPDFYEIFIQNLSQTKSPNIYIKKKHVYVGFFIHQHTDITSLDFLFLTFPALAIRLFILVSKEDNFQFSSACSACLHNMCFAVFTTAVRSSRRRYQYKNRLMDEFTNTQPLFIRFHKGSIEHTLGNKLFSALELCLLLRVDYKIKFQCTSNIRRPYKCIFLLAYLQFLLVSNLSNMSYKTVCFCFEKRQILIFVCLFT